MDHSKQKGKQMLKTVNIMDHNYDDVPEALRCMASVDNGLSVEATVSARCAKSGQWQSASPFTTS